jgi:hypothetical protein
MRGAGFVLVVVGRLRLVLRGIWGMWMGIGRGIRGRSIGVVTGLRLGGRFAGGRWFCD